MTKQFDRKVIAFELEAEGENEGDPVLEQLIEEESSDDFDYDFEYIDHEKEELGFDPIDKPRLYAVNIRPAPVDTPIFEQLVDELGIDPDR